MRFLHTADLHVGANKQFIPDYLRRQEEMFDSIFDVAYDKNVSTVVIAGDIFDDPDTTSQLEREMVERKLLEYDSAGFNILMIPGNHDLIDATGHTAIHYLSMLYDHGKLKYSCVTERTTYVTIGDTVFCLLCHRKHKFQEDLKTAVDGLRSSSIVLPHKHFVMVAHETIRGALSEVRLKDGSYYKLVHGEDAPDASLPVTYWALGDIHKTQTVTRNAFYSGSPLQTKFNDTWPKGVLLVDTEDPENPSFIPIPSNQFVEAKKGDIVPPNSYVKWKFDSRDEIPEALPSNVVKVAVASPSVVLSLGTDLSLKDKLIDGVKQQGATEQELAMAEVEITSLLELSTMSEVTSDV